MSSQVTRVRTADYLNLAVFAAHVCAVVSIESEHHHPEEFNLSISGAGGPRRPVKRMNRSAFENLPTTGTYKNAGAYSCGRRAFPGPTTPRAGIPCITMSRN